MMKRITVLITIAVLILGMAACSGNSTETAAGTTATQTAITATAAPTETATPTPTETAAPTPAKTATPTPSPSPALKPTKTATAAAVPSSNIVIIATSNTYGSTYGEIRGGYSKGKWLSESEAAAYCKGKMTFNEYNLVEFMGIVESSGVIHLEEDETAVETNDGIGTYDLNLPEGGEVIGDYYSYLYSGGKLPDIEIVSDTTEINSAVQDLLDNELGEGEAEAEIDIAVRADIDNDGKKETVVNASDLYSHYSCIIESDGTVKIIDDDYFTPGYLQGVYYVQNIIDIDGDGLSELVVDVTWGADCGMDVFKYDGKKFTKVLDYYVFYDAGS